MAFARKYGDFQYGALFALPEGIVDTVISGVSNSIGGGQQWDKSKGLSGTCDILGRVHQLLIMGIHGNPQFFHFQGFMSLTVCKTFIVHGFWGPKVRSSHPNLSRKTHITGIRLWS